MLIITHINRVDVPLVESAHMSIREKTIREERKQNEFRQRQELIAGKCKPGTPWYRISMVFILGHTGSSYRRSRVMCSSPPISKRQNEVNPGDQMRITGEGAHTAECIDRWPSRLLDLGDDA